MDISVLYIIPNDRIIETVQRVMQRCDVNYPVYYGTMSGALECRGWVFKSPHSDQNPSEIVDFRGIFLFFVYCGADVEFVILNISFRQVQT